MGVGLECFIDRGTPPSRGGGQSVPENFLESEETRRDSPALAVVTGGLRPNPMGEEDPMSTQTTTRFDEIEAEKAALGHHPAYGQLTGIGPLRRFMEHHVVCVLDFMSIVKSLQRDLTSMGPVWVPPVDPEVARFINEIVLDEESDVAFPGPTPKSHFEWYLAAMDEVGADTGPIRGVLADLRAGVGIQLALRSSGLPAPAIEFGCATFDFLEGPLHVRAAVFFHGREDVIPRMFMPLVRELKAAGTECGLLLGYLERHIEADGEHHGPLALRMMKSICGESGGPRWAEAEEATRRALGARRDLWDAVADAAAPTPLR